MIGSSEERYTKKRSQFPYFNNENNKDYIYADITFKIKYKKKSENIKSGNFQNNQNIKKNDILDGYTTIQKVALKKYRNIDKILSDFIRGKPTFLGSLY